MNNLKQRMWSGVAIAAVSLALLLMPAISQAGFYEWTWISGSDTVDEPGIYGIKGTPDDANVPGAREDSVSWIDSSGNLWLFGGWGLDSTSSSGPLNDLWRYDPAANQWTWMSGSDTVDEPGIYGIKGTPDDANVPGARASSISWIDSSGNLWLFGGLAHDSTGTLTGLNDLWRYDSSANQWTWMSGSNAGWQTGVYGIKGTADAANVPGAHYRSISWVDSFDNLWLFGGFGRDSAGSLGWLNDLWSYDPAANQWTWISGSNIEEQAGIYGIKGTPDDANMPGARYSAISWVDSSDNLWLFGGYGRDSAGISLDALNDLWRYDPAANQWTWMSGSDTKEQAGIYGIKGTPDAANVPGARDDSISWTDSSGNLWLFGGWGFDNDVNNLGSLNDLWRYDPDANQWTWISGSDTTYQAGIYGTKGTPDSANVPGARDGSISWIDSFGNLWLFGAMIFYAENDYSLLNDLWRYELTECLEDDDCPDGVCLDDNTCAECAVNGDCSDGVCLDDNTCAECAVNGDCSADEVCLNDNTCAECAVNGDCSADEVCLNDNTCAECTVNGDCSADEVCLNDNTCAECADDGDCDRGACVSNVCIVEGTVQIDKCKVKAGKPGKGDSIKFSGFLDASADDFDAALGDNVVVIVEAPGIPDMDATTFSFPIEVDYLKKGKYKSPKDKIDPVTSLKLDTIKGKMKFSAKNADLSGLSCPMTITFQIGIYVAEIVLDEAIVNGKKPCPPELMEGI